MYYPDLTCYRIGEPGKVASVYPALKNIGWLWKGVPFPQGEVPLILVQKLKEMLFLDLKNLEDKKAKKFDSNKAILIHDMYIRGEPHRCQFCEPEQEIWIEPEDLRYYTGNSRMVLGGNEMCIPSLKSGEFYIFPTMLYHYVAEHKYLPPKEFLDALASFSLERPYNWEEAQGDLEELEMLTEEVNNLGIAVKLCS